MPKSKKYLSLLILPFLFSCGEKPNVSSSEPASSETPSISSEIPTKDVFSSFIEKGKINIGVFEVRATGYDFPLSTYSFYGQKAQLQQYSDDFKEYYKEGYNADLLDGGILINGEQGAFTYRIENNQVMLESPVGYATNLIDLKSYGPALLADASLYEETDSPFAYTSKKNKDGSLAAAKYWAAVAGINSTFEQYMDGFSLILDENLENIVTIMHFQINDQQMTYQIRLTHLGDTSLLPPSVLTSYLSSPKVVPAPTTWTEESKAYIHANKPVENLLPFPEGATAQYSESYTSDGIIIVNYGVNLISSYGKQLLAKGFKKRMSLNTEYLLELTPEEGDTSFLYSAAKVTMKYASNATMILIELSTDYQNFNQANEELSLWNNGTYNKEYDLGLNYATLPESNKVTRVHSYDMTLAIKEKLASSGYANDILYYWLAEVDISSKEDAIAYANSLFEAQKKNGFFLDEKTTLEKDGYLYVYKVNSKHSTEAVLRVVLDRDDMGEYSGTIVLQAIVGNYQLLDQMLKENPYEK